MTKARINRFLDRLVFYLVASAIVLAFALPLVWMLVASLRTPGLAPPRGVEWLPQPLSWSNYPALFKLLPLGRYFLNSLILCGLAVGFTLLIASWAGFGMAQLGRRARRWLLLLSIGILMAPLMVVWLARYVLIARLGLVDSYLGLLAPALMGSSPLFVLLFYWGFRRMPVELFEAARLEGAAPLSIWRRVAMPLARPTTATVAVLTFILYWNDFINPLIYLKSQSLYTLAIGLQQLQQLDRTNWPLLLAAALVMTLPVVLLFIITQRYYLQDYSSGS